MKAAIIAGCVVLSVLCAAPGAHASTPDKCVIPVTGYDAIGLYSRPYAQSKQIASPLFDTILYIDGDTTVQLFKGWTHVGFHNGDKWVTGWAKDKEIKPVDCPGPSQEEPASLPLLPPEQVR